MKKKIITFDLETIADKSVIPLLPPVEPDSRLKDPVKIKANIKEKEKDRISKLGLDPATARICCFGWYYGKEVHHVILEAETHEAEKKLLQQAWEILVEGDHFATFNGNAFDVPMLKMRSLVNHVRPAVNISTKKYTIQNHTDVRAILANWDPYKSGTLDFYSKLLLGDSSKDEFDGSCVQDMWDLELYEDIGNYCNGDCITTYEIFQLLTKFYL